MVAARLHTTSVGAWVVLTAGGELDCAVAPKLARTLARHLDKGASRLVVDVSATSLLDCTCIGALVESARRAGRDGARLYVVGAAGRVLRVLQITGAADELGVWAPEPATEGDRRDAPLDAVEAMLAARAALPPDDPCRHRLREAAIASCLPPARRLAGHYRQAGQPGDDLTQVAMVGVLKAVDRYDPARGAGFLAYATPTISGELRRYFRDRTWAIHVPRQLQELRQSVNSATEVLTQRLCRTPTSQELAGHLRVPAEDVRAAQVAAWGYRPASLSQPVHTSVSTTELGDLIGVTDRNLDWVDHQESLGRLVPLLSEHERRALAYRFYGNLTQTEIARRLGVSQMQVSRLQTRALNRLREGLQAEH